MKRLLVVLTTLLITACASNPPEVRHYLLSEPGFEVVDTELSSQIALGSVRMAEFISGSGLVVQQSATEITTMRQHRWGDRLDRQLERQFRQGLSQIYPGSQWVPFASGGSVKNMNYRLDLYVDAFHITSDNTGRVRVQWFLRNTNDDTLLTGMIDRHVQLAGEGYDKAVTALSSAWHQTLVEIGEQVQSSVNKEPLGY